MDMKVYGPASRWLRFLIDSQFVSILAQERAQSLLDVGCGEGTITHQLAEKLPHLRVTGIDFSRTGINCAASRYQLPNLSFVHDRTSEALSKEYDIVTAFEVLEHIGNWQDFLARIAGAARGFVLLSFPTGRMRSFEKQIGHYCNFKRGEVEAFMLERGFQAQEIFYAGFPFYSPLYRDFCNMTQGASDSCSLVTGSYGFSRRILSLTVYCLFRFFSTRRRFGDQFCGLFARKTPR